MSWAALGDISAMSWATSRRRHRRTAAPGRGRAQREREDDRRGTDRGAGAGAVVVHTDDIAWYHAMFDWSALITEGVLAPLRRGAGVAFRPPEWDERGRPGAVAVRAGCPLVVVEGVGIGRRDLAAFFDALVWVQADRAVAWPSAGPRPQRRRAPRRRRSGTSGRRRSARSWRPSGRGSARTSSSTGHRSGRTTR